MSEPTYPSHILWESTLLWETNLGEFPLYSPPTLHNYSLTLFSPFSQPLPTPFLRYRAKKMSRNEGTWNSAWFQVSVFRHLRSSCHCMTRGQGRFAHSRRYPPLPANSHHLQAFLTFCQSLDWLADRTLPLQA